jgi:imidazolonepropionase
VPTFLGAHEIPEEYLARRSEYVQLLINEMIPRVAADKLAEYCDVFCEDKVFTTDEAGKILSAARCHGLGLRIHADQLSLSGGAKLAAELGTATADHLEHTDADGIVALQAAGVQPVLLPASVYALGSTKYPAARAMIDAGLAVVLATDFNPGSSPTTSMPMVLSLAVTQMKMTPAEAITAATINAAHSLGRGEQLGSLEPGKLADFVIHDCADYRELAYFFGIEQAVAVYVGGFPALQRSFN